MPAGIVKKWMAEKGLGWIKPDDGGDDLFVHVTNIEGDHLEKGDAVIYETVWNNRIGEYRCSTCSLVRRRRHGRTEQVGVGGGGDGVGGGTSSLGGGEAVAVADKATQTNNGADKEHALVDALRGALAELKEAKEDFAAYRMAEKTKNQRRAAMSVLVTEAEANSARPDKAAADYEVKKAADEQAAAAEAERSEERAAKRSRCIPFTP